MGLVFWALEIMVILAIDLFGILIQVAISVIGAIISAIAGWVSSSRNSNEL